MAQNQVKFGVGFKVDKSGLNDLKKSLQDIIKASEQASQSGGMQKDLEEACKAAKQLESILNGAWNSKLGQLNLDKVNQGIKSSYKSVGQLRDQLGKAGSIGVSAYNKMASEILSTNLQLKQSSKLLDDMATSMANTVKWGITSSIFNSMTNAVQNSYYYVKNLDSSLNDIRIVTGASADQMTLFAEKANAAAKALGQSTRAYTDASLIYYQQGLGEEDVAARAETTLKAANVTGQRTDDVSELLTSVWNGYKVSASEAELYIDKIAAVAATTAADLEELSVGMSKVASAASLMGVDIDQLNAQLATIVSVTRQAPESVGTALKTIYARMGDIEAGLDSETTLGNYTEAMLEMGFSVLDTQGKLRDMGEVIEEIGYKWGDMTREQQLSLAQTVAGTRQYNNLLALFDNWDMYTGALQTSTTAMGTLQEQQDIYMESTEAHLQQLSTEAERLYSTLLDTDVINGLSDIFTGLIGSFTDFIDGIGGGENALVNFGFIASRVFNKQISQSILRVKENLDSLKINKAADELKTEVIAAETERLNTLQQAGIDSSTAGFNAQVAAAKEIHAIRQGLTQEQYQETIEIQKQIGLETNKLEKLKEQKAEAKDFSKEQQYYKDIATSLDEDIEDQIDREKEKNKELENSVQALLQIKNLMLDIQNIQSDTLLSENRRNDQLDEKIQELETSAVFLEDALRDGFLYGDYEDTGVIDDLISSFTDFDRTRELSKKDYEEIENSIRKTREKQEEHNKAIQAGNQILYKRHLNLDGEIEQQEKIINNLKGQNKWYSNIGKNVLKLQNNVQSIAMAGQMLTAIGGGIGTLFDKAATGAEKANSAFSMAVSISSAIPGIWGIIAPGVLTVAKAGLEVIGVWDNVENLFKSTAEKAEDLKNATSEAMQIDATKSSQIKSLKDIQEEYENLSSKVGTYGEKLDELTEEEQTRYHELTNSFIQYNDAVILGYDEQGNAIVNNQTALKETIALLQQQQKEQARAALGNISEGLTTKDTEYNEAKKTAQTTSSSVPNRFLSDASSYLNFLLEDYKQQFQGLEDFEVEIEGKASTVSNLLKDVNNILTENYNDLSQDNFENVSEIFEALNSTMESIYSDGKINDSKMSYFRENVVSAWQYIALAYNEAADEATFAKKDAEATLANLEIFDASYIMQVVKYGEGYDVAWNSLTEEGQKLGSTLIPKYIEGFKRGVEGSPDTYAEAVEETQKAIYALGEALEISSGSIELVLEKFNLDNFEGSAKQYNEYIEEILNEILKELGTEFSKVDPEIQKVITDIIATRLGLSDLDISTDGQLGEFTTQAEKLAKEARNALQKAVEEHGGSNSQFYRSDFLSNLLTEEDLANFNSLIEEINWGCLFAQDFSSDAIVSELERAKSALENITSVVDQYNTSLSLNESVIDKIGKKESLTVEEQKYLDVLEKEFPVLKNLGRGADEYAAKLEEIQKFKKDEYAEVLKKEAETLKDNIKSYQDMIATGDLVEASLEEAEAKVAAWGAELANIEYEININAKIVNATDLVEQIQEKVNDAVEVKDALSSGDSLNFEQATLLEEYKTENETLRKAIEEYGLYSTETIEILNDMITNMPEKEFQATKAVLEEKIRLKEEENRQLRETGLVDSSGENIYQSQIDANQQSINATNTQIESLKTSLILDQVDSVNELKVAYTEGAISLETYANAQDKVIEAQMEADNIDLEVYEEYLDYVDDLVQGNENLTKAEKENSKAIKNIAARYAELNKGFASLQDNWEDWEKALKGDSLEDYVNALVELKATTQDLLGVDVSDKFFKDAQNLEDLALAAEGNVDAIDRLRMAAAEDIVITATGVADWSELDADVQAKMQEIMETDLGDYEVGASLDDTDFIRACEEIVNAAAMTAEQAHAFLTSMGIDAHVQEIPVSGETNYTYEFPEVEYDETGLPIYNRTHAVKTKNSYSGIGGFALRVSNATYGGSSGGAVTRSGGNAPSSGSGGGGSKGKSDKTPEKKDKEKDYYREVDNTLQKLTNRYDELAEAQDKAFGEDYYKNIDKTNKNLKKQIKYLEERKKIALEEEQKDIKSELGQYGAKIAKDGTIANYDKVLDTLYAKHVAAVNAGDSEAAEEAWEQYENAKELMDRYETITLKEIPDMDAQIREKWDQIYDKKMAKFEKKMQLRIDWGEAERDYNEFLDNTTQERSSQDFEGNAKFQLTQAQTYFDSEEISGGRKQLNRALKELSIINSGGTSSIWGQDKQALMDYIDTLKGNLMNQISAIYEAREEAYQQYLDAIDDGIEKFDKHLEQYDILSEQIQHNMNLISLLYGENSEMMEAQYELQESNYLSEIESQKIIVDTYKQQMDDAKLKMDSIKDTTSKAYEEAKTEYEKFEGVYQESVSNLNMTVEEAVQNLIDKYKYSIRVIIDNMNKSILGSSLDYANTEWDLMNKKSEQYLDNVNAAYEVQKLENKYLQAINETDSSTAQAKLNKAMQEQLKMLQEKDQLSQYEIDRANQLYELTLKQTALEEAQQNKSKMRLRRDAQGNYSYAFVADDDDIQNKQNDLLDAQNNLYNLDKEAYKSNLDEMYNYYVEWQEKLAAVYSDQTMNDVDRMKMVALINEEYEALIKNAMDKSDVAKANLGDSTADAYKTAEEAGLRAIKIANVERETQVEVEKELRNIYKTRESLYADDALNFEKMTNEEKGYMLSLVAANEDQYKKMTAQERAWLAEYVTNGRVAYAEMSKSQKSLFDNWVSGAGTGGMAFASLTNDQKDLLATLATSGTQNYEDMTAEQIEVLQNFIDGTPVGGGKSFAELTEDQKSILATLVTSGQKAYVDMTQGQKDILAQWVEADLPTQIKLQEELIGQVGTAGYNVYAKLKADGSNFLNSLIAEGGPLYQFAAKHTKAFLGAGGIESTFNTAVTNMKLAFDNEEGQNGLKQIVTKATDEMTGALARYELGLANVEKASGKAFGDISDEEKVEQYKKNIEGMTEKTKELKEAWVGEDGKGGVLAGVKAVVAEIDKLIENNPQLQKTLEMLKQAHEATQGENKGEKYIDPKKEAEENIKMVEEQIEAVKNGDTGQKDTGNKGKGKKKSGNDKLEKGDKVTIKSSYAAYAGGEYIDNPKYKEGSKLYVQEIPGSPLKVKANGKNWVAIGTSSEYSQATGVGWIRVKDIEGYDTGGYTGTWNSGDGKLAVLHQKEMVLNQADTKNILEAVTIMRGLSSMLQTSMLNRLEGLTSSLNSISIPTVQSNSQTGPVEQTVHIEADFPGVSEAIQIQQALEGLMGRASQYAFKTRE